MKFVLAYIEGFGITLTMGRRGGVILKGLDCLQQAHANDLVNLARANKSEIIRALEARCPYTTEQLDEVARTQPELVCCPNAKWWWRERSWCDKCVTKKCEMKSLTILNCKSI